MRESEAAEFQRKVTRCLDDINRMVPGLSLRYDSPVILTAMAEHVGCAIWAMRDSKVCDTRQVNLALAHLEAAAFPGETPSGR
jgi:hypothetical protein